MFLNTPDVEKSLFFDDGLAWATGSDLQTAINKMQNALDTISQWGPNMGIQFSTLKTKYMIFTRKPVKLVKENGAEMQLSFYGAPIERAFSYKYLGLIFDPWLTWGPHIKYLVDKCQKPLSVLQCVANKNLGADRKSLATLL